MRISSKVVVGIIGITAILTALEASAQFGGGGMPGGGMRGGRNRPDGSATNQQRPLVQDNSPEQLEDRLGMLEEDLRLSAEQRVAWQSYADKIRALINDIGRERERGPLGGAQMSALSQIDRVVDAARNRLTALEDIATAAKTLYAGLSPQQKVVADPRLATIVSAVAGAGATSNTDRTGRARQY
jgi:uncharacterized protein HemX